MSKPSNKQVRKVLFGEMILAGKRISTLMVVWRIVRLLEDRNMTAAEAYVAINKTSNQVSRHTLRRYFLRKKMYLAQGHEVYFNHGRNNGTDFGSRNSAAQGDSVGARAENQSLRDSSGDVEWASGVLPTKKAPRRKNI
jgi:hypothetical protein